MLALKYKEYQKDTHNSADSGLFYSSHSALNNESTFNQGTIICELLITSLLQAWPQLLVSPVSSETTYNHPSTSLASVPSLTSLIRNSFHFCQLNSRLVVSEPDSLRIHKGPAVSLLLAVTAPFAQGPPFNMAAVNLQCDARHVTTYILTAIAQNLII